MQKILDAISSNSMPTNKEDLVEELLEESGKYTSQEGLLWDFKRSWPFSYSDEYFGGIARLICAFANTHGGIIIFGVHDETRQAGHNKVNPNNDRLQQALDQLLTGPIEFICRRYDEGQPSAIDVLLVRPIRPQSLPTRFKRSIGKYRADTIWVRQNNEVLSAEPRHVPLLYCRASAHGENTESESGIEGGLPPSPATIKKFVGRLNTIDRVFYWIKKSDEPRTFLFGKGGSGKTTIAYEVAKVLKLEGAQIQLLDGSFLDNVIFVSAKQHALNVIDQKVGNFVGLDFSNERELYQSLLTLANWTSEPIDSLTIDELKSEIRQLFDLTSNFIVIDDIDTLTTQGMEAGFDFLYSSLWRARKRSKILYTTRNAPSQSLANSIEVQGLEDGDYEEFIRVCSEQFRVPMPELELMSNKLSTISERRPLVVESIIALRRTSGSYERGIALFEEDSGEDVRRYVFQREWNSLPPDNVGRYILAVMALYQNPIAFEDITTLTRYEPSRVKDGLADIREMFLQVNEVGEETIFKLGALTTAFVFEQSKKLDHYPALKERVVKYKVNFYPENPILSRLKDRIESLIAKGVRFNDKDSLAEASRLVTTQTSPKISEDPRFISLQAFVLSHQVPHRLDDIRRLFGHVFAMRYEPDIEHLKRWFFVERDSGHGIEQCIKVCDFIAQGRRYSEDEKIEFLSRKATNLYMRGRNEAYVSPERTLADLKEALRIHLLCFTKNFDSGSTKIDKSEEYARNTAYYLFDFTIYRNLIDEFFDVVQIVGDDTQLTLDPIESPLLKAFDLLFRDKVSKGEATKRKNKLASLKHLIAVKSNWYDTPAKRRVLERLTVLIDIESPQSKLSARSRN